MYRFTNPAGLGGLQKVLATTLLSFAISSVSFGADDPPRTGTVQHDLLVEKGRVDTLKIILDRKTAEVEELRKNKKAADEIESAKEKLALEKEKLAALEERRIEIDDKLSAIQLTFEEYRDQYRKAERLAAKGEILDLSETKGESYKESKVLGVSALFLSVMRPDGPEGIPYKELPKAIQDRFQFGEDEAAAYELKMAKSDAARAKQFAEWKAKQNSDTPEAKSSNLEKRLAQTEAQANVKREEGDKYRALSDEWREKAARYWKSMKKATSDAQLAGIEKTAYRAEEKANTFLDMSRVARSEAVQLASEALEIRTMINQEAIEKEKE